MAEFEYLGKPKLPRGFSLPLSYSTISTLIQTGAFPHISGLAFVGAENESLISAHYYGPRSVNEFPSLTLWVNAVPSTIRKRMNGLLINEGLPLLSEWATQYADPTLAASQLNHRYRISYHHMSGVGEDAPGEYQLMFQEDEPSLWNNRGRY